MVEMMECDAVITLSVITVMRDDAVSDNSDAVMVCQW